MDCRHFRKQHAYFVDDMLSGVATWAMRDHLASCLSCARFDSQLRRALLVARQTPTLEPSRQFQRRLSARLAAEKLARPKFGTLEPPRQRHRLPLIAAAAAILAIGVAGIGTLGGAPEASVAVVPVAAAPRVTPARKPKPKPITEATLAQPVNPAMLLPQGADEQFAETQARAAFSRATH